MSLVLTPRIQTADQLSELIMELREYIGKLRDISIRGRMADIHDESLPALSPLTRQLCEANNAALNVGPQLQRLLTELEEIRVTAPHMRVMLAAWPTVSVRERITEQVRTSIYPYMVVTFAVRADMGGGCVLTEARIAMIFHSITSYS